MSQKIWGSLGLTEVVFYDVMDIKEWLHSGILLNSSHIFIAAVWWIWRSRNSFCLGSEAENFYKLKRDIQLYADTIYHCFYTSEGGLLIILDWSPNVGDDAPRTVFLRTWFPFCCCLPQLGLFSSSIGSIWSFASQSERLQDWQVMLLQCVLKIDKSITPSWEKHFKNHNPKEELEVNKNHDETQLPSMMWKGNHLWRSTRENSLNP